MGVEDAAELVAELGSVVVEGQNTQFEHGRVAESKSNQEYLNLSSVPGLMYGTNAFGRAMKRSFQLWIGDRGRKE